ncbi:asparaginase [Nonomuraea jiangxiensis]|uniref:L-asparaginase n=1 Tax=Nonomuraea jiangxiensis TaxID=633440 RepID=A0A1G8JPW7_9ACTN|nr:asparaginase [Nonomuraea jiangxiensis]SDI32620.1 L-asparaginase [Nonomuraea jiangxiensis]
MSYRSGGSRPRVTVFSLGGTIASTHQPGSPPAGVVPRLGARELVDSVPRLREVAELETVAFRRTASSDLTLPDVVRLAAEIARRFEAGDAGVVVTQGTDTVEESSFALELLVPGPRPVVVTGAMRDPTLAGPDGPANLLAAVRVAASPQAAGLGTLVVFDDEIHAARFVRKTHTSSTATFRSPSAGPLGWVVEGRVRIAFRAPALRGAPTGVSVRVPPVALLKATLGDDFRLAERLPDLGYAGLVVEALGGGHLPSPAVEPLERLARRMPVVLASRTGGGELLRETYGFPGSERDLLSRGLTPAGFLDGPKARVLLSLLLSAGAGPAAVRDSFEQVNASVFAS